MDYGVDQLIRTSNCKKQLKDELDMQATSGSTGIIEHLGGDDNVTVLIEIDCNRQLLGL